MIESAKGAGAIVTSDRGGIEAGSVARTRWILFAAARVLRLMKIAKLQTEMGGGVAAWSLACAMPERVLAVSSLEPMVCFPGAHLCLSEKKLDYFVDSVKKAGDDIAYYGSRTTH